MKQSDKDALIDMCGAALQIGTYMSGKDRAEFMADAMRQDAVIRQLEIIGEAVTRLTSEFKLTIPAIPWRNMSGLRNILIHAYDHVDLDQVWTIATNYAPQLIHDLKAIPGMNLDDEIE